MLSWWNKNDVYDEEDYLYKISDDKGIDQLYNNDVTENVLNYVKLKNANNDICMQLPEKNINSSIMQRSLCPWQWK